MLLEVLLARGGELHGNELEATVLEARDDGSNEATLVDAVSKCRSIAELFRVRYGFKSKGGCVRTWTPSGLMAMKLEQLISFTGSEG